MAAGSVHIPRVFLRQALAPGADVDLPREAAHHIARVLRMREGDAIVLFNGSGGQYAGQVRRLSRDGVAVEVVGFEPVERESPLQITLLQGISAGDRMDLTLQKAVELGVAAIQPVVADRSVVRLKGDRSDARRAHWQRVAEAACEQCGRNRIPPIAAAVAVSDYLAPDPALKLLLDPTSTASLRSYGEPTALPIVLAAGPEAGFSPREEAWFVSAGFSPVRLGPRVLRTETAGPAAIAALNALYGDG